MLETIISLIFCFTGLVTMNANFCIAAGLFAIGANMNLYIKNRFLNYLERLEEEADD